MFVYCCKCNSIYLHTFMAKISSISVFTKCICIEIIFWNLPSIACFFAKTWNHIVRGSRRSPIPFIHSNSIASRTLSIFWAIKALRKSPIKGIESSFTFDTSSNVVSHDRQALKSKVTSAVMLGLFNRSSNA